MCDCVRRLTRDRDRITEILDIVKFLCRVFWKEAFQHQVDKLQTNHKVCVCVFLCVCVPGVCVTVVLPCVWHLRRAL